VSSLLGDAFAHHVWATEQLIDFCGQLSQDQLQTYAPGTRGPIMETLRHIVGSDTWYLSFYRAERTNPFDAEDVANLSELRAMISRNGPAWTAVLAAAPDPDEMIVERGNDGEYHSATGVRLAQVIHHGTDHRSQVCTALTSLGIEPPDIDVWAYARASGRERTSPGPAA
jgi:uncharacterized damage-inducible protein DinB